MPIKGFLKLSVEILDSVMNCVSKLQFISLIFGGAS